MKKTDKYVSSLLEFLDNSPCNFLAVDTVKKILTANGFKEKKIDDKMAARPESYCPSTTASSTWPRRRTSR